MVELTILEALNELKLLRNRINKLLQTQFVGYWKSDESKTKESICSSSKSNYQSVQDLIKRMCNIKAKIMQSNATTFVTIGKTQYTIAEAIAMKEIICQDEALLARLKEQYTDSLENIEEYNVSRQRKIDFLLEKNFSKDTGKASADDIRTITEMYQKKYYIELIDPLDIKTEIENLEDFITTFQNNVNTKLSHSNAITKIIID